MTTNGEGKVKQKSERSSVSSPRECTNHGEKQPLVKKVKVLLFLYIRGNRK